MFEKIKSISSEKKNIFKNFTAMGIIQILNYVMPFITLPYLARVLSVEKFGLIFFAQACIDYFLRFTDYGFNQSGVRELAINRDDKNKVDEIFTTVFFSKLFLLIVSFIFLSAVVFSFEKFRNDWLIYYFTFLTVVGNVLLSTWFFQGMERMKFITFFNVLTRTVSLVCIFSFVRVQGDYYLVPLFNSLGLLVAGIVSFITIMTRFKVKIYLPKIKEVYYKLKGSSEYFLSSISIGLYQSTNTFVLGLCISASTVAFYVSAQKIYMAIYFLYYPFYNAFFPYMSKNKDIKFFKKVFKILVIFSISLVIFTLIFSKFIINIFYGAQMSESYKVLNIFAIMIPFHILADIMSFPLLGAFGYTKETNQCWIFGGIFNCLCLALLYIFNFINIYSVASLLATTYFVMFLHRIYYVRKYKILSINPEVTK